MSPQEIKALLFQGERAFHKNNYRKAVSIFEQLYKEVDSSVANYFDIQRKLVKAYKENQQIEEAVALCQEISSSPVEAYRIWAIQFLSTIAGKSSNELNQLISGSEAEKESISLPQIVTPLRQKSLTEFKEYCQENLLPSLKKFELQRKYAIASILISGIIVSLIFIMGTDAIFYGMEIEIFLILIILWFFYCQGCVYVSQMGFKREIIEKIVRFIDDKNTLIYANKLLIEDNRSATLNFTESQLFQRGLIEPDYFKQEDCVYGTTGNIDIFFSEVMAQNEANWHQIEGTKTIFRGLFFVAKFPKNFRSRAFILPQVFKHQVATTENWRGELVNLEDVEFDRYFRVYSYDQIEARYILSTNLMARLVNFRKQVKRHLYISFIDGHIFVAIPYQRNLFEPHLFKSMLSFTPLREYFDILQFMTGIVRELNLNQTIWDF